MKARRARSSDARAIFELIAGYAQQGLLLPRAEHEIQKNISHFLVHADKKRVVSCVALESYGTDLAEIRSLAVDPELRGRRAGTRLLEFALAEACRRGIARVFAVTHAPEFFVRQGFEPTSRHALTEKVERDCRACPKRRSCQLVAVVATVIPERIALPILADSATPHFGSMTLSVKASQIPRGFSFSSAACGLKKSGLDLGLLVSETPAVAAAMFTQNQVIAAPVLASQVHLRQSRNRMRGIIVNSGNANCCTGSDGVAAAAATTLKVARELDKLHPTQILVCSTGVIGVPLRVEKILKAVPGLVRARSAEVEAFAQFTRAIMTTDTRPKWAAANCRIGGKIVRILGCCKGAGMIQPNMATMLAFLATDAAISPSLLSRALRSTVAGTFNAITVDGDTSTNDTVAILANGESGARRIASENADFKTFCAALEKVCRRLALKIVEDGEGAQRVIEIEVRGAPTDRAATQIARTIANSPLVKTALAGADPNWGRILAAAGRAGVPFDFERVDIKLAGILVCRRGAEHPFSERIAHKKMLAKYVPIAVEMHSGKGAARVWTCDFTREYVDINASYRT